MFEGHAFIVEAAVSVGGRDMKPGLNIYRCAPACACACRSLNTPGVGTQ